MKYFLLAVLTTFLVGCSTTTETTQTTAPKATTPKEEPVTFIEPLEVYDTFIVHGSDDIDGSGIFSIEECPKFEIHDKANVLLYDSKIVLKNKPLLNEFIEFNYYFGLQLRTVGLEERYQNFGKKLNHIRKEYPPEVFNDDPFFSRFISGKYDSIHFSEEVIRGVMLPALMKKIIREDGPVYQEFQRCDYSHESIISNAFNKLKRQHAIVLYQSIYIPSIDTQKRANLVSKKRS